MARYYVQLENALACAEFDWSDVSIGALAAWFLQPNALP
jgi:hypothetical protein